MPYQFSNLTVLVVESNNAMFDLTRGVLESFGIGQIVSAYNVAVGYQQFKEYKPDLVIIDWLDDQENGLTLTEKIRTSPDSPNPFVPIIMMTGYSQKRRVTLARDSGITEFVVKPFTAATLYKKIESIIEKPRNFVKSPGFFGPDRRRQTAEYTGNERRKREQPPKKKARLSDIVKNMHDEQSKNSSKNEGQS